MTGFVLAGGAATAWVFEAALLGTDFFPLPFPFACGVWAWGVVGVGGVGGIAVVDTWPSLFAATQVKNEGVAISNFL